MTVPAEHCVFLSPIWVEALRNGLGLPVEISPLVDPESGRVIGQCLLHVGRKGFLRKGSRPFASLVNVDWIDSVDDRIKVAAIRRLMWHKGLISVTLREYGGNDISDAVRISNFCQDLSDGRRWDKYSAIVRRSVKRAISEGFAVSKEFRPADFFRIFSAGHHARARFPLPFSEKQFCAFAEILSAKGHLDFFFSTRADGSASAAHAIIANNGVAYDILSQRDPQSNSVVDNYFLLHKILNHYAERRFRIFDHCGANIPAVREFKRRFSPREVWLRTRTHRLASAADTLMRKWFKG